VRSTGPGNETTVESDRFVHYKTGIWSTSNDTRDGETEKCCRFEKCLWLPGAGLFLRSWLSLNHKKSSSFCGTGNLLTFAQQPETDLKLKPYPFHNLAVSIFISVLALSFRTLLGLSSGLLISAFPNNISYVFVTATMRATCPNPLIILYLITIRKLKVVKNYL
jgi:hypothetical protein